MEQSRCRVCGTPVMLARVDAKTCSARCRKRLSRRPKTPYPIELVGADRWLRWEMRAGKKVPVHADTGRAVSVTDPGAVCSYLEAAKSRVGDGLGFVLAGDGIGCYDLDGGVLNDAAARFVDSLDAWYVEVSPSGTGLHCWVDAEPCRGWRRMVDGIKVEFYTQGRYMTMTGRVWEG